MPRLNNNLIKASAGTGKTFALATRMIRLMLLGVEPNKIVALTFSRAAAGEIFNKLASRLAEAAACDAGALQESDYLYHDLSDPLRSTLIHQYSASISRQTFITLLRRLIATQHASLTGTIDSFMTRMVQAFPLELGFQGNLMIMDQYRVKHEKTTAVNRLLNQLATPAELQRLITALRQTFSERENKSFNEKLAGFVTTWHNIFLDHPHAEQWGQPTTIWLKSTPFHIHDTLAHLAQALTEKIMADWTAVGREATWADFCTFVRDFDGVFSAKACVVNVLKSYRAGASDIEISYNKKTCCFDGEKALLIQNTIETLYAMVLTACCASTQGIYNLMSLIESIYARHTRTCGLLTFDDIPRLIKNLDSISRQNIEYRFDSRFSHWALDEFQDTSNTQWVAIRNLIDEVIQAEDDERSLFIVGDMKQAIYGWRGGNVEIFKHEAESGHYALTDLNTSYRYGPEIADMVNRVFDGDAIAALLGNTAREAGTTWQKLWHPHCSQQPASFVHVERVRPLNKEEEESKTDPYIEALCAQLKTIRPWERGLSTAILVRNNAHGTTFADALRRANIPAVWEGESTVSDTPVVTALLHLLQVAEHPGNTLAWQHVCATPLAHSTFKAACALPREMGAELLSKQVLNDVSRLGLSRTLRAYIEAFKEISNDPFTRSRLDALLRAAGQFTESTDVETTLSDFTAFVEAFTTRDVADISTVKIQTIHRSKGLGFDLVLLPIIEHAGIDTMRLDQVLFAPNHGWLLKSPAKTIIQADETLREAYDRALNENVFEELCVYYVAMTRAKRACILLLNPLSSASSTACYFSSHIEAALGGVLPWQTGARDWYQTTTPTTKTQPPSLSPLASIAHTKRRTLRRLTPSATAYDGLLAGELFTLVDAVAAQRGTQLHAAISRIEWLDTTPIQPLGIPKEAFDLTIASPARNVLLRPSNLIELWREQAFELVIKDQWISGSFDRVVFINEQGKRRAVIYDFKSNHRRENESTLMFEQRMSTLYTEQMQSYRLALAHLSGLPQEQIDCTLILTATLQALSLPSAL